MKEYLELLSKDSLLKNKGCLEAFRNDFNLLFNILNKRIIKFSYG